MRAYKVEKDGSISTSLKGKSVLSTSYLNKGSAFTEEERENLHLQGLLPPMVLTLEEQVKRAYEQFKKAPNDLQKNNSLNDLHNRNVVLFYRLLTDHLSEML
ncbi:NAD-dependent malic enzyme, partial [Priestia megaterium]